MSPPDRRKPEAFPPELPPTRRYTLVGELPFESQVQQDLSRFAADLQLALGDDLGALLLVGRFARGEGSMISRAGEPHAYPGYACLAIMERMNPELQSKLMELETTWTQHLRTGIRLAACTSATLAHKPYSLAWYELGRGSVELLMGDTEVLHHIRGFELARLDQDEPGWLLTEQCMHLAHALAQQDNPPSTSDEQAPVDPVVQALQHLALACGDSELLLQGQFSRTLSDRLQDLRALELPPQRFRLYEGAIHFLARPDLWLPASTLEAWKAQTLADLQQWHLALEAQRVGAPTSLRHYVCHRDKLFHHARPERRRLPWHWFERPTLPLGFPYIGDGRERVARAAAALAYGQQDLSFRLLAKRLIEASESHPPTPSSSAPNPSVLQGLLHLYRKTKAQHRDEPCREGYYW